MLKSTSSGSVSSSRGQKGQEGEVREPSGLEWGNAGCELACSHVKRTWARTCCCTALPQPSRMCVGLQFQLSCCLPVLQDLLKFYFFAFLLQLCVFMLFVSKANMHPHTARSVVTRVVDIFIAAAPTGAPTVVVAALTYCIVHLNRSQGLVVLLPEKIKTIADVEVVCFDKTGTLTGSRVSPCLSLHPLVRPPFYLFVLSIGLPIVPILLDQYSFAVHVAMSAAISPAALSVLESHTYIAH